MEELNADGGPHGRPIHLREYDYHSTPIQSRLVGVKVLIDLARILSDNLCRNDIPGRWGGEEFLIILRQQTRAQAGQLAEKLRSLIENHAFPTIGRTITASFGITEFTPGDFMEIMIKRADSALHQAKKQGPNQVVSV